MSFFRALIFLLITGALGVGVAVAEEFSSTDFKVEAPVVLPGGYSTSNDYQLTGIIGQLAVGTSTATGFALNPGFLSFPFVSTPVVSATAGNAQTALSWTAASGSGGWTVTGYNIGQSTASGGPYGYSSLGNVLSSTRTGLSNGMRYYFVIRPEDAFGNSIATSSEVSALPTAPSSSPSSPSVSGGGPPSAPPPPPPPPSPPPQTAVNFSGRAYPNTTVTLLKDAQVVGTTVAGADARFQISQSGLSAGHYIFSVYTEDKDGRRSSLFTFPVSVTAGVTTDTGGIFIPPTIAVDKSEVKRGDNLTILGQSAPAAEITVLVSSEEEFFSKAQSDKDGVYLVNFDTAPLEPGQHTAKSKASLKNEISTFSELVRFKVGEKTVPAKKKEEVKEVMVKKIDVSQDGKINLVDFSVVAYWYKRPLTEEAKKKVDISGDGKVNLVDFSIMAYYWTG